VLYFYLWWIIPIIICTILLFGFRNFFGVLGLNNFSLNVVIFALISVSPMLISSMFMGQFKSELGIFTMLRATIFAAFNEELLFRGFLFGLLFRKFGWGFIPAASIGAIFFGLGHIYQGNSFLESLGIFAITAMGAAWFAWLYVEWNFNLWIPIFLHLLMNLSWTLFDVSQNAMGGLYLNVFRALTIALTIIITIKLNGKNSLKIKKSNLVINKI
jgi:membrane protease YdiL (CAAX protease family)